MKISDYRIVQGSKNRPLATHVKYQIDKGYQPYGYPYLDKNGVEKQAMVTYEEAQPKPIDTGGIDGQAAKPKTKKRAAKNED